jgi:F-type H+-transporting ATPase subunit epsilon
MAGHAPFMTVLKDGDEVAVYRTAGGQPERIPVSGGFDEMGVSGLTILAEKAGE